MPLSVSRLSGFAVTLCRHDHRRRGALTVGVTVPATDPPPTIVVGLSDTLANAVGSAVTTR